MSGSDALIRRIEAYYDAAPRLAAAAEDHGPLTLFVPRRGGFPLYARPRQGRERTPITAENVDAVRTRQRALDLPEEVEWVDDLEPSLGPACEATGLVVSRHPLMVLDGDITPPRPAGLPIQLAELHARSPVARLRAALAVPAAAFAHPGTAIGPPVDLEGEPPGLSVDGLRSRIADGSLAVVLASAHGRPVGVASMVLTDDVAEVVGVGTLPEHRRRGIAAAATGAVVEVARRRGAEVVFLSAADDDVARLYAGLGFRRVATAATAGPPT